MIGQAAIVLGSIFFGFFLDEMKDFLHNRQKNKKQLSAAMQYLLLIRSHIEYFDAYTRAIMNAFQIPEDSYAELREFIEQFAPDLQDIAANYESIISNITSSEVLLGRRLQSTTMIPSYFSIVRRFALNVPNGQEIYRIFEETLFTALRDGLDSDIQTLAAGIDKKTSKDIKVYLEEDYILPEQVKAFICAIRSTIDNN